MKTAEEEQARINKGLPRLGGIGLLNTLVPRTGFSILPWCFCYHGEATRQPPWSLISSGVPGMSVELLWNTNRHCRSDWKIEMFDFCTLLQVQDEGQAINLLIINNSYLFSGVRIWNKILKNDTFLWRSVWFFGQPDTYRPTFPTFFQHLPAAKHLLSSVQCRCRHCRRAISSPCRGWT